MKAKIGMALVGVLVLAVVVSIAWAQSVPQLINYQGRLTDNAGRPLDGVTVDLTFSFYGVESGGTSYLTVLQEDVMVTGGLYNVMIGSGTVNPGTEPNLGTVFHNHQDVWMGVAVDSDSEMTPRSRITSVPYALQAPVDMNEVGDFVGNPDWDGDGYLKTGNTLDCNDGNSAINPGAGEICDDAFDNDCDGDIDGDDVECLPGSPMALIPSGCFDMGDAFSEGDSDELPLHNVCITSDFYMDVHEVTNAEYKACVDAGLCTAPEYSSSYSRGTYYGNPTYDNFPVIYVDWNQATAYCSWAGKRLPTEAEWEYAARGGLSGKRYSWGDTATACVDANFDSCFVDTSEVESYSANGYGLYDVGGNVWEWVNDWYSSSYYSSSPTNDPPGPSSGTSRVYRGGGWAYSTDYLRVAYRFYNFPTYLSYHTGFRCAWD